MRYRESAVLAADGRPVLIATEPAYRSAGTGRRFAGFSAPQIGPNAALLPELPVLRARSRALYRSNDVIWGAIETLVANLVGWGIAPKSLHDREAVREKIDTTWGDWSRQVGLDAIQVAAAREFALAGEVFLRLRPRRAEDRDRLGRRLLVPLEVELLEPELCPVWDDRALGNGRYVRGGIQFDPIGRREGYWMFRSHPGDYATSASTVDLETRFVPADQIVHLYNPESPGQIRGTPRLARVLLTAHDLDAFHAATLQRQAIAALFAGFIRRTDGSAFLGETAAAPEPTLEPGTLSYLGDGEEITFPPTPDVGSNYAAFVKAMHLKLAAGTGLTYEQVSNDLSGVNYSSIRAGALEFRRRCQAWQYTIFCPLFLEAIWVRFLRQAALAGALNVPNLLRDEVRAGRVEWITQGWEWVDPLKEVQAADLEVKAGFDTRAGVNMRRGNDPRRIENERKAEIDRAEQLGLAFSNDVAPGAAVAPPSPVPTAPDDQTDDESMAARARGGGYA